MPASFPPRGLVGWDDELKTYVDTVAAEEADAAQAAAIAATTATATAAGTAAGTTAGTAAGAAAAAPAVTAAQNAEAAAELAASQAASSAALAQDAAVNASEIALGDADAALAGAIANPASDTFSALSASYASRYASAATKAATAPLLSKLKRGVADATILYIGDSTGNETIEHIYLEMVDLGARFPAYTVLYYLWNDGSSAYDSAVTIQTGTGSQTLRVYNCSVAGSRPEYVLGARWSTAIAAVSNPDCIFISHSHNTGDPATNANGGQPQRWIWLSVTEELAVQHPGAGMVLMSQNPTFVSGRETWQAKKAQVLQDLAAQRGYGFIDVHQAFVDTGAPASYVKTDLIHPTTSADTSSPNGSRLWADVVGACLQYSADAAGLPRQRSSLLDAAKSLVPNVDFATWSGTLPDGFTATNATVTKDTTTFETGTYSMKIEAGASGASYVEMTDSTSFGYKGLLAGRPVTLLARVYVPVGYTGIPSIVLKGNGGSAQQARRDSEAVAQGRWHWVICTRRDTGDGGSLTVQLSPRLSGSAAGYILVDRFRVVEGDLPRDAVTGQPGPTGATGSPSSAQRDHLSTYGTNPAVTMWSTNGAFAMATANQAVLVRVRAHRAITVAKMYWRCSTAGGNYDIGIYDAAGNKLWSKGSTATPGSGSTVTETVSPTVALTEGSYYWIAFVADNTTLQIRGNAGQDLPFGLELGGTEYTSRVIGSSFPLPATISVSGAGSTRVPTINLTEA